MAQEIERKFLVDGDFKQEAYESVRICQGYLSSVPGRTVRVRVRGEKGYLTIKGAGDAAGVSRFEWEHEIGLKDALELMELCEPGRIDKMRYLIKAGKHVFEVDEFFGENAGLVLAEVELNAIDEAFEHPQWLGQEVTGDVRFYNAYLACHPYKNW